MYRFFALLSFLSLLVSCADAPLQTTVTSTGPDNFLLELRNDDAGQQLFADGLIHGSHCEVDLAEIAGRPALRLATLSEFSDAFMDFEALFGHAIDFRAGKFFYFDAYVPEGSWIASLKFNHKTADGSFGGCGNSANNLAANQGRWFTVEIPVEEWFAHCKNWSGESDFLSATREFTVNPYNANRVDTGVVYLNNFQLTDERREVVPLSPRNVAKPELADNSPYTITWDDRPLLEKQLAWRSFEATTQHITSGKFGNPTNAIRSYGTGQNKYICLLPDIEQMTGRPVNFHDLDSLHFRYYLTEDSAPVHGARLFITTGDDWDGILMDHNFMREDDFTRGQWTYFSRALDDLELEAAREPRDVLAAVYELRLDLQYDADSGPIEIWYDDFGWK